MYLVCVWPPCHKYFLTFFTFVSIKYKFRTFFVQNVEMDFSCKTNTTIPFLLYVVQFSFDNLQVYSFMWLYFALPLRTKQSRTKGSQFLWIYTSQAFTTKVFSRKKHISSASSINNVDRFSTIFDPPPPPLRTDFLG